MFDFDITLITFTDFYCLDSSVDLRTRTYNAALIVIP